MAYLLGIESARQASRDPLRGNIFENIVVLEAMKTRLNDNKDPNLFYVRTEKGVEIDLILKKEGKLYPYEIKSSAVFTTLKEVKDQLIGVEACKLIRICSDAFLMKFRCMIK